MGAAVIDTMILAGEIAGLVVCATIFALAVTGRRNFSAWERANLNKVAVFSALGAMLACALLAWRFF